MTTGNVPKLSFNWEIYRALYPDLTGIATRADGYAHWLEIGIKEGRIASLEELLAKCEVPVESFSQDFDWVTYLELNPDLKRKILNKEQTIIHHIQPKLNKDRVLSSEGYIADITEKEDFDWEFYLWYNQDIKNISSKAAAWEHWINYGKPNNRLSNPREFYHNQGVNIEQLPNDFNIQEYIKLYPELEEEGINSKWHIISHFLQKDKSEQHIYSFKALGIQLRKKSEYQKAIEAFEKAIRFNPSDLEARLVLFDILVCTHKWKRVLAVYRNIITSEQLNLHGLQLYKFSRELGQILQKHLELLLETSRCSTKQYLDAINTYSQALWQVNESYSNEYNQFQSKFNASIDEQAALGSHIYSLNTIWRIINNDFKNNFRAIEFIRFQTYTSPTVSVIIPVYNKIDYTIRCLISLFQNISKSLALEVVVVNDSSTDDTKEYLEEVEGLILVNNSQNIGFIHSCNAGAKVSKGEFLYFLNNDTEVQPGAIESLVNVFRTHPTSGAVGSKLIYPSGALQEAGGIIWQDVSGWNYGRNDNPLDPKYNFLRSVDYCSGASFLVKKATFEKLNGFEKEFAPAYYEDTDLCFAIRDILGLDIFYQPQSKIIHYEGVSSGTSTKSGVKRFQAVNAEKFRQKWEHKLQLHPINQRGLEDAHHAARRFQGGKTILVIDSYLPCYDKESGSRRLFQILKIFKELDYHVIYLPNDMQATEPYLSELQNMQIEALYTCEGYGTSAEEQLKERLPWIDVAWVCRPELMERYIDLIRKQPGIKVVYDTIDLHYLRLKREMELGLSSSDLATATKNWMDMQSLELYMARRADMTITVTVPEQQLLQEQGIESVEVIPNIHVPYEGEIPGFDERSGILFIGGYNHPPNVDAVEWLCKEIMPIVWQQIPSIKVTLLGSNPSERVKSLASDKVTVPGYEPDVSSYFLSHRVFIAPLRYGAGMKGKIGQSLEYGLPLVSTTIGVEGMNLTSGENSLEANDRTEFAQAILHLYGNRTLWNSISANAIKAIEPCSPGSIKGKIMHMLLYLQSESISS